MRALSFLLSFAFLKFLSLLACGAILLSLGPAFQQHSVALFSSQSPSIYQSVYSDGMIEFSPISAWLTDALLPRYVFGSMLLILGLKKSQTFRGGVVLVFLAAFFVHMAIDIYNYLSLSRGRISLLECFASNALGCALLSFLYVSIASLSQAFLINITEHPRIAGFISSIAPVSIAILALLIEYYILALFFNPSSSYVEARVGPDATISLLFDDDIKEKLAQKAREKCQCDEPAGDDNNFKFLNGDFSGHFSINGQGSEPAIVWNPAPDATADITIEAYDGCYASPDKRIAGASKSTLSFKSVNTFEVKLPPSLLLVRSLAKHGNLNMQNVRLAPIWLKKEEKKYSLTRFVAESQPVDYRVRDAAIELEIVVPLIDITQESRTKRAGKELMIVENGKPQTIKLLPSTGALDVNKCSPISIASQGGEQILTNLTNIATVRLTIKPTSAPDDFVYDKRNHVTFKGLGGWYSVSEVESEHTKQLATPGLVQSLSVFKGLQYLSLNGRSVEKLDNRMFTFDKSSIQAHLSDDNTLIMKGESNLVWVDKRRLSPTRWENMDIATQGILLGLAGVLVLGLGALFRSLWQSNPALSPDRSIGNGQTR